MNYEKIYDSIINRAKNRELTGYKERHHIIPKCLGGDNKKNNLVYLTAREHFICHWLLHLIYPKNNKILLAFYMMCNVKDKKQQRYTPSSRIIEYAKIEKSRRISGDNHPKYWLDKSRSDLKGKKLSKEVRNKISKSLKGHKVSDLTKKRISNANSGKITSNKTKYKLSLKTKEFWNKKSKEDRKLIGIKISKSSKGKIISKEHKLKISESLLKNPSYIKPIIQKDLNGNIISTYKSVKEAMKLNGFSNRIFDCLKGKRKKYKGYIWQYK